MIAGVTCLPFGCGLPSHSYNDSPVSSYQDGWTDVKVKVSIFVYVCPCVTMCVCVCVHVCVCVCVCVMYIYMCVYIYEISYRNLTLVLKRMVNSSVSV